MELTQLEANIEKQLGLAFEATGNGTLNMDTLLQTYH